MYLKNDCIGAVIPLNGFIMKKRNIFYVLSGNTVYTDDVGEM